ncbi:MAG: SPFH domain-containing protein, partial [Ruminococcus sp.]|nr:SPFH domain-containing protein [Ruminococcus sp.]
LCGTEINVMRQAEKEAAKNQGANIIKCEASGDYFVWKHPIEDFGKGSQLIVHESQEAIFYMDGKAPEAFGAGRYSLDSENLCHSRVYFVNMTARMGIKWGTDSKVRLFDPASGLHIEIGACGSFNICVCDSKTLLRRISGMSGELTGTDIYGGMNEMTGRFKALVINRVKSNLARAVKEENINILEIDSFLDILSEKVKEMINENLAEYGLNCPEFFITSIVTPDDDPNYKRLKQQFADKTLRVREEKIRTAEAEAARERRLLEAQTEAQLKMVSAQGDAEAMKLKAMAEAEAYKAQAFAEAEEMKAKGYTYQQETARQIGLEAMQNGIASGSASALGDIAGMGAAIKAMGGIMNLTGKTLEPLINSSEKIGSAVNNISDTWDCSCGEKNITSRFCPSCGGKRPEPKNDGSWKCECGTENITSKFCPNCGAKRPEPPEVWDCPCGCMGITSKFCPDCGSPRPVPPAQWICSKCGQTEITSNFCPGCGSPKPVLRSL